MRSLLERCLPLVGVALLAVTAACFNMEYGLVLDRDLSGTATLEFSVDPDRLAYISVTMQKAFSGEEGEPTEEEIAEAKKEILAEIEEEKEEFDPEEARREVESDLPEGVELLEVKRAESDLGMWVRLAFDHVENLNALSISPPEEGEEEEPSGGEDGQEETPTESESEAEVSPFGDLKFVDEGETFVLTNEPVNPVRTPGQTGSSPDARAMTASLAAAFPEPLVIFRVAAPFEVVEHNATRVEDGVLYWEYGLGQFDVGGNSGPHMKVRFRR